MEKIEIKVTKTSTSITNGYILNKGEYQVDKCKFTFSDEYADLVKKAIFVDGETSIDMVIDLNDECNIPYEILQNASEFTLKVYGYTVQNGELVTRYSPTSQKIFLRDGSYQGSKEVITPSQFEQYEQQLHNGLVEVNRIDIDAIQTENGATVTITKKDNTTKTVEILNGEQGPQGIQGPAGADGRDGTDGQDATINGVNTLNIVAGENITLDQEGSTLTISSTGGGAVSSVNGQTGDVVINIPDVSNFITKDVNNLTYYELKTAVGNSIAMSIDSSTYVLTVSLKNSAGTILNTQTVDLPLETMVVGGSYDSTNKKIILTLKNGQTIEFSVADLVSGLQSEITSSNKLSADLVDDTNTTNKFVSASDKTNWNNKISRTDYAGAYDGGTVKVDGYYDIALYNGKLYGLSRSYSYYTGTSPDTALISKGTLENVLNERIGDIDTALDLLNGEVI